MKRMYKHTFKGGVTAEMTLEMKPDSDDALVFVAWAPEFDPAFLESVMDEYMQWSRESIADYSKQLGRGIKILTI